MMPVPWKLWEGQVVDSCFPLRRYLGGSDRSAVYLTQYGDGEPRNAAIKLVLTEPGKLDPAAQWDRAALLSHPNLLRLLRTGKWQVNQLALLYAVTDYAEENLAEVLAERPLTAVEVREMLKPMLEALAYIHAQGLVHGHLKPANIMAVGDDLKLSVDGVSLVGEPGPSPAKAGPYDPPEFRDRGCSPVGDVWSFGVTLVEALTQRLPTLSGPKQAPVLPETVAEEFLPIVRACLQPDPRRRASLADIRQQFERAEPKSVDEPAAALPATSRKWLSLTLAGAAAVALAGILAGPRLLQHPAASAHTDQAAVAPAAPAVTPLLETAPAAAPSLAAPPARPPERAIHSSAGDVVHQVLPDVPEYARRTIRGKVRVEVRASADAAGHVTDAMVESENSRYFAKLALAAARQWEFTAGPSDWNLRFEFTTSGTTVRPSRMPR